jgi:hypothetical protein
MQPRCDYSDMHLFVMTLSLSVLHVEAMIKLLEGLKVDHKSLSSNLTFYQDSILSQYKRQDEESTRHLSEGDLEEKQALILEDKAPGETSCVSSRLPWKNAWSQHYESVDLISYCIPYL